jgi:hypothetical protein
VFIFRVTGPSPSDQRAPKGRPTTGRPLQTRFPKELHHRRAADDSLAAKKPQASNFVRLEIERVKGGVDKGLGRHLSATDQLRRVSCSHSASARGAVC